VEAEPLQHSLHGVVVVGRPGFHARRPGPIEQPLRQQLDRL
jgi:hypothetical protein